MSSKKNKNGPSKGNGAAKAPAKAPAPPAKKNSKGLIIGIVVVAIVAIGVIIVGQGGSGGPGGTAGVPTPTPEEAKYIGRFLPAGYEEPNLGEVGVVAADTQMVPITASQTASSTAIPVSEVTSKRVVGFNYQKADGQQIALISYLKPSGKLVVAVSYCVPCKGTSHTLTTDGALTCDACGTKRDVETSVGLSGSCRLYPLDELPVTVDGDQIIIDNAVLDSWQEQPGDRQVG